MALWVWENNGDLYWCLQPLNVAGANFARRVTTTDYWLLTTDYQPQSSIGSELNSKPFFAFADHSTSSFSISESTYGSLQIILPFARVFVLVSGCRWAPLVSPLSLRPCLSSCGAIWPASTSSQWWELRISNWSSVTLAKRQSPFRTAAATARSSSMSRSVGSMSGSVSGRLRGQPMTTKRCSTAAFQILLQGTTASGFPVSEPAWEVSLRNSQGECMKWNLRNWVVRGLRTWLRSSWRTVSLWGIFPKVKSESIPLKFIELAHLSCEGKMARVGVCKSEAHDAVGLEAFCLRFQVSISVFVK